MRKAMGKKLEQRYNAVCLFVSDLYELKGFAV